MVQGRYYFADGATFTGVIADNSRLVNGKYKDANWIYQGSFNNGTFDWLGVLNFSCLGQQCTYEGKFENGVFQGQGSLIVGKNKQKIFKGTWDHGVLQSLYSPEEFKSSQKITQQKSATPLKTEPRKFSDESLEVVSFVTDQPRQKSVAGTDEVDDEFIDLGDDELLGLGNEIVAKEDHIQSKLNVERKPKLMMKIAQSLQSVNKITDYEQRLTKAQERVQQAEQQKLDSVRQ